MCWLRVWQCADQLLIELTKNSLLVFWWWLVRAEVVVWGISFTYSQGNKLWWHTTEFPLLYFVVQTKRPIRERDRRYRRSHFKNALAKHAGQNSWCICGAGLRVHTAQIWPVHNILKKGKQYGEYHHLLQCFVLWVVSTNINLSSAFVPLFLSHTSTLI